MAIKQVKCSTLDEIKELYAQLIVRMGVNIQPNQSMLVRAELEHAPFVRYLMAVAYEAGARYVHVQWVDALAQRARLLYSSADNLDYVPPFVELTYRTMLDEGWARLALVGPERPNALSDVPPELPRRVAQARSRATKFYTDAVMNGEVQWCVAAVPTTAWAKQIFPALDPDTAKRTLWMRILDICRLNDPDPLEAWQTHDRTLGALATALVREDVRSLRFFDATPAADGHPRTDISIGLTERPNWVGPAAETPKGVRFFANIPTEEIFSTPHRQRVEGYVRTSKPAFPLDREVSNAFFRFREGELVEFHAETGEELLHEFFAIRGTKRLGEVALVDVRSPINRSGVLFRETLYDENAVSHIAFGQAYPEGVQGGADLTREELNALGVNDADSHVDFMIGSDTMRVIGTRVDGSTLPVMEEGRFVPQLLDV